MNELSERRTGANAELPSTDPPALPALNWDDPAQVLPVSPPPCENPLVTNFRGAVPRVAPCSPKLAARCDRIAPAMELERLLDELTRAAERAGIAVRFEPFDPNLSDTKNPRGGLCTVHGRRLILIDAKLSLPDRIATIAASLAGVDLDHLYLPPVVRATIGAYAPGSPDAGKTRGRYLEHPIVRRAGRGVVVPLRPRAPVKGKGAPLPPVRSRKRG
jgi:hypothetical protein